MNRFADLEKNLWSAADNLRANSDLKSQEYSTPVLGLIFLKYADNRFTKAQAEMCDTSNYLNEKQQHRVVVFVNQMYFLMKSCENQILSTNLQILILSNTNCSN